MLTTVESSQRKQDSDEKPPLLRRVFLVVVAWLVELRELHREARNERWARKWLNANSLVKVRAGRRGARGDAGNAAIIGTVIAIAVFVALVPFIAQQVTAGQGNLTNFTGASALLGLVPLILVAVLILGMWSKASGGGHNRRG